MSCTLSKHKMASDCFVQKWLLVTSVAPANEHKSLAEHNAAKYAEWHLFPQIVLIWPKIYSSSALNNTFFFGIANLAVRYISICWIGFIHLSRIFFSPPIGFIIALKKNALCPVSHFRDYPLQNVLRTLECRIVVSQDLFLLD